MTVPVPTNLPLLFARNLTDHQKLIIEQIYKNPDDLANNLTNLSRYWKVKIWFTEKLTFKVRQSKYLIQEKDDWKQYGYRYSVDTDCHTFNYIYQSQSYTNIFYATTRSARKGYYFPPLEKVVRYEPVI